MDRIGKKLARELIAEQEFKPSWDGDFQCGTETNLLLHAACEVLAGQNAESNLHALLRGFQEQIMKHHAKRLKQKIEAVMKWHQKEFLDASDFPDCIVDLIEAGKEAHDKGDRSNYPSR